MESLYRKRDQVDKELTYAKNRLNECDREIETFEKHLKQKLTVGRNVPCKLAQLLSGEYVVHVYREEGPTWLFIVELTDTDL